jgi:hypothetical protein
MEDTLRALDSAPVFDFANSMQDFQRRDLRDAPASELGEKIFIHPAEKAAAVALYPP